MFNPDLPIETCEEEKKYGLERCKFAQSLANAILKYKEHENLVIGLDGEWGSGKTSITNMAREHIIKEEEKLDSKEKSVQMKFNPWNFTDQNQLILQFFNELIIILEKNGFSKDIVKKITTYASKITITSAAIIISTSLYVDIMKIKS